MPSPQPLKVMNDYEDMSIKKPTTVRGMGRGDFVQGSLGAVFFLICLTPGACHDCCQHQHSQHVSKKHQKLRKIGGWLTDLIQV